MHPRAGLSAAAQAAELSCCDHRWIASNDTCPVCRASLTERPLPPAPASCLPQQQHQQPQQAAGVRGGVQQMMADQRIEEELLFRLGSVRRWAPLLRCSDAQHDDDL